MTYRYRVLSSLIIMLLISGSTQAQIPVLPVEDNQVYLGKEYGAAGIIKALIKANTSFSPIPESVNEMIISSAESIWEERIVYDGVQYPSWSKSLGGLGIYPGDKYGPTGIMQTFLDIYQETDDSIWLDRVISAYNLLLSQAINSSTLPHWGYHYQFPGEDSGIAITDRKYGSGAVIDIGLRLYDLTEEISYLNDVGKMIDWLVEISLDVELNNQTYQIIPWYWFDDAVSPPYFTGYDSGIAGLIPLIYTYGKLANSSTIMEWATSLVQFLGAIQLDDGSWISESETESRYTGFDTGVAGVLFGLHQYSEISGDLSMEPVIKNGISWLFSQLVQNSTHSGFFYSNSQNKMFNSFNTGSLGVLWTLLQLQSYLTNTQIELLYDAIDAYLENNTLSFNLVGDVVTFPLATPYNFDFVDLSLGHGAAGLLSALVDFNTIIPQDQLSMDLETLIEGTIEGLAEMQRPDSLWNRQVNFNNEWVENAIYPVKSQSSQTDTSPTSNDPDAFQFSETPILIAASLLILIATYRYIRSRYDKS